MKESARALWLEFRRLPKSYRRANCALVLSMFVGWVSIALPHGGGFLDGLNGFSCSLCGVVLGFTLAILRQRGAHTGPTFSLTLGEIMFVNREHRCPDCLRGLLWRGEHGPVEGAPDGLLTALASRIEVKCSNPACRHEFNLLEFGGEYVLGMRIPRDAPELYQSRPL